MADMYRAARYNATAAERYGWYNEIPAMARAEYPGLGLDCVHGTEWEKQQFAKAVLDYQVRAGGALANDGMMGPTTWAHLEEEYGDETVPVDWDVTAAVKYNYRYAESLGWYNKLPSAALDEYLGWEHDPVRGTQSEKEIFAIATYQFQQNQGFGLGDTDGKLGPHTWARIESVYAPPSKEGDRHYIYQNRRLTASEPSVGLKAVPYDDEGGLDLHKWGHFNSRNGLKPRVLVLHWGGIDPNHLHRVFSTATRKVSSHGGIGRGDFYQFLDMTHSSWHAGYVNKYSIGVDICQQPTTNWLDYYTSRGYDVKTMENPARRPGGAYVGNRKVLTLDPEIAQATLQLVKDICSLFDIPMRAPRGEDGLASEGKVWHGVFPREVMDRGHFTGVVGHHHLSSRKWDMACWWGSIFDGTELGD